MSAEMLTVREARLLRALDCSLRRLVPTADGWAVMATHSRRRLALATTEEGDRLIQRGWIERAEAGGGYVLADAGRAAERPAVTNWAERSGASVFFAAGLARGRRRGVGFPGLAHRAQLGDGPLSLRQAATGLRLIADAERCGADPSLSMNWSAVASTRMRRTGDRGATWIAAEARQLLLKVEQVAGAAEFALARAACVDGMTLRALEARFGLTRGGAGAALGQALENVAAGYDATR